MEREDTWEHEAAGTWRDDVIANTFGLDAARKAQASLLNLFMDELVTMSCVLLLMKFCD